MSEAIGSRSWSEELASLMEDPGIRYTDDGIGIPMATAEREAQGSGSGIGTEEEPAAAAAALPPDSVTEQVKEFLKGSAEMLQELGRGCRDIIQQSLGTEDSYVARKLGEPWAKVSSRLRFLNEYLPEDRDPVHAWPVVLSVLFIAFLVLNVNTERQNSVPLPKKVYIPPPSATRVQLPDGRYIAYQEQGVPVDKARFSLIAPHSFLSSRLAGIPGIKTSLLEEFGIRLITYDLPGFGESDPHPRRNLNSSALDISFIANAVGVEEKFWLVGYSTGAMHAWAALKYIPDRIAGAAMFSPMCNPYDSSMTKEERERTREKWTAKRKLMYFLARRFPSLLSYFYRRTFLSGKHGQPDRWLSLSLGKRDRALVENPAFIEFWEKDVEESVRQWSPKPFVEEAILQVSHWGFSLAHLQMQKARQGKGLLPWLKSVYGQAERDWTGFLGPIHIWQGMDDTVVPPSMVDFVQRVVPGATVHRLLGEGHFSYYYFCDECHRHVFATLFGPPQGPLSTPEDQTSTPFSSQTDLEEVSVATSTAQD